MGILGRITEKAQPVKVKLSQSTVGTGGHSIDKSKVLSPTDATVINPMNTGLGETVRTKEVSTTPRYHSVEEAKQLKEEADQKQREAKATKRAYKSLKRIEEADADVHSSHRSYLRGVADSELTKKRADAKTAKHLHRQRPQYERLGIGIDKANQQATTRIAELRAKIESTR